MYLSAHRFRLKKICHISYRSLVAVSNYRQSHFGEISLKNLPVKITFSYFGISLKNRKQAYKLTFEHNLDVLSHLFLFFSKIPLQNLAMFFKGRHHRYKSPAQPPYCFDWPTNRSPWQPNARTFVVHHPVSSKITIISQRHYSHTIMSLFGNSSSFFFLYIPFFYYCIRFGICYVP